MGRDEDPAAKLTRPQKMTVRALETLCDWTFHVRGCWLTRKAFQLEDRWIEKHNGR